jgi:hypothetical protein
MAKKMKRQPRKVTAANPAASLSSTPAANGGRTPTANIGRAYDREFNPDYTPVIKDLKRIGVLAGSFFVILVALSFFLR